MATDYYELLPSNALELPLYLDADRMATLGRAITQEKFETQRSVVENERREDIDNRPYGRTEETVLANLFPEGHPYHLPVIGTVKDLDAATLDDVKKFFAEFYVPNDAILSIAGDVDPKRVAALVRKYFGGISRGPVSVPLRPSPVEVHLQCSFPSNPSRHFVPSCWSSAPPPLAGVRSTPTYQGRRR
jgi:zinc protease